MNFAFLTNSVSPHQLPLAKVLMAKIGGDNYRYIYTDLLSQERQLMGWDDSAVSSWCIRGDEKCQYLMDADVVMSGVRALDLFKKRNSARKKSVYISERWFKPPIGFLRLFIPSYFKMAKRFVKIVKSPFMLLMPIGIHAARDMARLITFMKGDVRALFVTPKLAFESRPGGLIVPLKDAIKANLLSKEEIKFANRYGFVQIPKVHWGKVKPQGAYSKMRLWGYFVESTKKVNAPSVEKNISKVLWVGRMLGWKRVKDLIKACGDKTTLSIYGNGPTERNLKSLANANDKDNISFYQFVPISEIRNIMRKHEVYVLPSNAYEGWGAVVSEALEEGMKIIGTIDAGSTATILPPTHLYKAGDVKQLRKLLSQPISRISIGEWSVIKAAEALIELLK